MMSQEKSGDETIETTGACVETHAQRNRQLAAKAHLELVMKSIDNAANKGKFSLEFARNKDFPFFGEKLKEELTSRGYVWKDNDDNDITISW